MPCRYYAAPQLPDNTSCQVEESAEAEIDEKLERGIFSLLAFFYLLTLSCHFSVSCFCNAFHLRLLIPSILPLQLLLAFPKVIKSNFSKVNCMPGHGALFLSRHDLTRS